MSPARARLAPRRRAPPLEAKKQPEQQRAAETVERILESTAAALADIGFERLSTNIVCARAGLTPPALYRYFPNKYALLYELGRRLMQRQNALVPHWITAQALTGSAGELEAALAGLLIDTHRVTAETAGGVWIMRALRAVPTLQSVRLESHAEVTEAQTALLIETLPGADPGELRLIGRIAVEMIYAAVEMLFDEPLDVAATARVIASMIASQLSRVQGGEK